MSTKTNIKLNEGDTAPDFTAPTNGGNETSLSQFRGQTVVLYFYPKDNTPGCNKEACGFRDAHTEIATKNALMREDINFVPAISNGFTDSRFTRPLGVTTYGFSGSHPDDDPMLSRAHGTDESIGIKSLVSGAKIMLHLAYDILAVK